MRSEWTPATLRRPTTFAYKVVVHGAFEMKIGQTYVILCVYTPSQERWNDRGKTCRWFLNIFPYRARPKDARKSNFRFQSARTLYTNFSKAIFLSVKLELFSKSLKISYFKIACSSVKIGIHGTSALGLKIRFPGFLRLHLTWESIPKSSTGFTPVIPPFSAWCVQGQAK